MVTRYAPKSNTTKNTRYTTPFVKKNTPIYEFFYKALSIQKYRPRIREKFKKFGNISSIFNKIDWKSLESSLEGIKDKLKYVKTIWQLWYTRKRAFREKQSIHENCPFCTEEQETCLHVLACKNRRQSQHQFAKVLSLTFKKNDTSPVM